ncbi:MAG: Mu transposase C-terminal domain-containing protein [Lachnospiraceae bacterium]|nr:Mu transposase C-terminal domain-containing protein [Lachnospiraceae bacterium]
MVLREEMYFEPRTISPGGSIRWFGETYSAEPMLYHTEQTVYIRDNGRMLFIYELDSDKLSEEEKIEAVFTLICKIEKPDKGHRYGRKIT